MNSDDISRFQGKWRPISVEVDGVAVAKHLFSDATLRVTGNRFVLRNPLPDSEQRIEGTIDVDESTNPKQLTLVLDTGETVEEIYELGPTMLRICYPTRKGKRPTGFATAPQSGLSLVVYEKDAIT